jgi:predicted lipoprotein with Yx(FWY)xxD motif
MITVSPRRDAMSFAKSTLLATALSLALATAASAQNAPEAGLPDKTAVMVDQSGKLKTVGTYNKKINAKGHATIMKYAKKLPPHTMIYRSGDDIYVLEGQALQNDTSQTLSDHAKGWIDSD